ncbi:unnamed protein product [Paramecium sonneborni]|uniref:Ubiquitin-like protease family profile domain-containing protein n=1 Tax=Paramecium sonneborni TaxID=65129 RepID=A0A8S1Q814_9CILI|nr:unnamed protein product [Paramecium sonneborni]
MNKKYQISKICQCIITFLSLNNQIQKSQKLTEKFLQNEFKLQSVINPELLTYNQNSAIYIINNIKVKSERNELLFYLKKQINKDGVEKEQYFYYKIEYDLNFNPEYQMYKGEMNNQQPHGYCIKYSSKSKEIQYDGKWYFGQKIEQENIDKQYVQNTNLSKKIIIQENGVIIRSTQIKKQNHSITSWIKFNQQISPKDLQILENKNTYFTCSIIDSYALYLTMKNEEEFFNSNLKNKFKRQLFLPSYLFTNMWQNEAQFNKQIFQNYFLEFQYVDYQIIGIYQQIYFAINQQFHWYLVKIKKKYNKIFDSIKHHYTYYQRMIQILYNLFNIQEDQQKENIEFNYRYIQNNQYDCGPYACLNMKLEFFPKISKSKLQDDYLIVDQMKKELFYLLQNK